MPEHAVATGRNCVSMGNLLANTAVPQAMVNAFTASDGAPLAERAAFWHCAEGTPARVAEWQTHWI